MRPLLVLVTVAVALLFVGEIGFRLGRKSPALDDATRSQIGTVQAAILGLLALLLAFTFSEAANRYDVRKQVLLDEANAIGTAYLRSGLLPEPERAEVASLLRRYVDLRLEFYDPLPEKMHRAEKEARLVQGDLWALAEAASRDPPQPIMVALFVEALNEMIDIDESRLVALENHLPGAILTLIVVVAGTAVAALGFGCGLCRRRLPLVLGVLPLLIAFVIAFIVDLDRPMRGLVRVGQQSMLRLRDNVEGPAP